MRQAKPSGPVSNLEDMAAFEALEAVQADIEARCVHPQGGFIEFPRADIEQSIPARFEAQVEAYPDRLAVQSDTESLTYTDLNQQANRIAHRILATLGPAEAPILLLFDHDSAMIAAIMGALKAGKFYIALDPSYPVERTSYILQDSQAEVIVSNSQNLALAEQLAQPHHHILNIDDLPPDTAAENPALPLSPDRLAYIIYTSGSTGNPKGVYQNHRNLLHNIMQYTNTLHLSRFDRFSLLYSCSVNGSLRDIFGALLIGASVFPYNVKKRGLADLGDWLKRHKITFYHSVATIFRYFGETLEADDFFPDVRLIRFGGERVPTENIALYHQHFPQNCIMYCGMGASETSTVRQIFLDQNTDLSMSVVPTGFAVAEREVLLLDESDDPVPPGEVGQIVIRSAYLSLGYWGQPELTAERFKTDPHDAQKRLYYTGDLGRLTHNDCLIHMGRQDFQVNLRGYRIEVAEIEMALMKLASIKEAAVMVRNEQSNSPILVAYVVPQAKATPSPADLRQALGENLPDYMIPSAFVILPEMPVTPNGKINRKALPNYVPTVHNRPSEFVAPRNELENQLVNIWSEILNVHPLGVQDNFFDVGGHSLAAMRLVAQVEAQTGKTVTLSTLFHNPTIETLAQALQNADWMQPEGALLALKSEGHKTPFFCLPGNLGNVFLDLGHLVHNLDPERPFYSFQDSVDSPLKIETVAARYLQELRAVQAHGPYALAGICWGGPVAYEMAQQLRTAGEEVAFLALIEPSRPWKGGLAPYLNFAQSISQRFLGRFWHHASTASDLQTSGRQAYFKLKLKVLLNDWATRQYRAKPYPHTLHLVLGDETLQQPVNGRADWRHWAPEKTLFHQIPGNHDTVVDPDYLAEHQASMLALGRLLAPLLDEALGE